MTYSGNLHPISWPEPEVQPTSCEPKVLDTWSVFEATGCLKNLLSTTYQISPHIPYWTFSNYQPMITKAMTPR